MPRSSPHRAVPLAALLSVCALTASGAAEPWSRAVPTTDQPPVIDGHLAAGEWQDAAVIADLRQVEPEEDGEPSEETRIYLLVDRDNLYIALDCRDSEPAGILGTQITRDARLDPDDRVELVFDTFLDHRNGYFFQIGPGGSKGDALIGGNGSFFSKDWDGIWRGRATITDRGWTAEIALPAKTLSLKPGLDRWGFNARRYIKRKNEELQWANPDRKHRLFDVASAGTLSGMAVLEQGVGLDVVPYLAWKAARDATTDASSVELDPGFDLRYRLTPGLTATFTANTDFAETEVDSRVVNLTRFPVFFPEKRDFFLEDSGIFTFGPFGDRRSGLLPFFSRRVGLSADGEPVPIVAGGKLTGRVGRFNVGLLDVATDRFAGVPGRNLAVARVSRNVLAESQVGALITAGDPASDGDNALGGLDFTYRTHDLPGGASLRLDAWLLGTRDRPRGAEAAAGHAFGVLAQYPNDRIDAQLGFEEVSDDFEPALGFVQRRGVRHASGDLQLRPRPHRGPVRRFTFGVHPDVYTTLADGAVESASYRTTLLEVDFHSGDRIEVEVTPSEERLTEPFEIAEGVVIAPGRYRFDRWSVQVELADKRLVAGRVEVSGGTFFDGRRNQVELGGTFRPRPGLTLAADAEHNSVDLPAGSFTTTLASLRVTLDLSPDVSWITFAQWDDVSDTVGINSRLRWILKPGRNLYFVVDQGFERQETEMGELMRRGGWAATRTGVTMKGSYTFRF